MSKCSNVICYAQFALATVENGIHHLLEDSLRDMTNMKLIRMKQYLPNWLLKVVNRLLSLSSVCHRLLTISASNFEKNVDLVSRCIIFSRVL